MKRRFEGGPGESTERENRIPAQPTKLQDAGKNKEKDSVKDSPTTHLTKVEADQDSHTQFQLEEKNTVPTFLKEDNNPTCLADVLIIKPGTFSSIPSSCAICSEPDHCLPVKKEGHRVALLEGDFCLHRVIFKEAKDVNAFFDDGEAVTECPPFSTDKSHLKTYKLDTREVKKNKDNEIILGLKTAKFSEEEVAMFQEFEKIYMGKPTKDFLKSLKEEVTLFDEESP